ncbi:MAG: helix-hairpin-helix domain-containing protein [Acutalibacteraceae bacterium]
MNCGRFRASGRTSKRIWKPSASIPLPTFRGKDPEELYRLDCLHKGYQEDRCQLYVYRLAVYYAETPDPDPDRLRWWLWKDPPDL